MSTFLLLAMATKLAKRLRGLNYTPLIGQRVIRVSKSTPVKAPVSVPLRIYWFEGP